jgi:hypothetical protein
MTRSIFRHLAAPALLAFALTAPAAADVTVTGRYTLANGDTLTRTSYYTSKRVRTTLPNGDEVIYDDAAKRIALIDHSGKRYWEGPKSEADSVAGRIRAERMRAASEALTPESREAINRLYNAVTDSVQVVKTGRSRKIAGYTCSQWVLTAGHLLTQERWVARALDVPDFSSELEKVVLATVADPVGSGLMKLVLQSRSMDGLGLAGDIQFHTMRQQGTMSWEAVKVGYDKVPPEAWQMPEGYQLWQPASPADAK